MKLKPLLLATMLVASSSAFANNYTAPTQALSGGPLIWVTGNIGTSHVTGAFTDTYTYTYSGLPGLADIVFANLGLFGSQISFTSASLNGNNIPISNLGPTSSGAALGLPVSGLLTLIIHGNATSPTIFNPSYGGILEVAVTAVPEPATYGMMLGGLALLGVLARQRRKVGAQDLNQA
ncbi:FxDxF family PEP-CTERM protein [Janthinobacterium agaricidamnosum]|uniref:PEP-CTERM putative exosortase interaction domain protein n=1 Tax=Janthinobacterium agaricidamnosum NBRC 102515 = DSM 9628 TaxID=1349767 RepID=W0VE32_9BURK|nr:FxDxF family PEP-CTERM protein [Janthinobacterium agaricidamnosum]CDG85567.1 PEP-CTERM putative exosortase interaction domain protein [Janthinobacterium agaricidamnosum NBRC 102515 = DSM 9628]